MGNSRISKPVSMMPSKSPSRVARNKFKSSSHVLVNLNPKSPTNPSDLLKASRPSASSNAKSRKPSTEEKKTRRMLEDNPTMLKNSPPRSSSSNVSLRNNKNRPTRTCPSTESFNMNLTKPKNELTWLNLQCPKCVPRQMPSKCSKSLLFDRVN